MKRCALFMCAWCLTTAAVGADERGGSERFAAMRAAYSALKQLGLRVRVAGSAGATMWQIREDFFDSSPMTPTKIRLCESQSV